MSLWRVKCQLVQLSLFPIIIVSSLVTDSHATSPLHETDDTIASAVLYYTCGACCTDRECVFVFPLSFFVFLSLHLSFLPPPLSHLLM